mmetsp:Transcript_101778/g.316649  ORF Transcript_101778/g.316649 Transcript_101778/m.316649 type:complete len:321 (-) Transcript_101778:127-1089(-)
MRLPHKRKRQSEGVLVKDEERGGEPAVAEQAEPRQPEVKELAKQAEAREEAAPAVFEDKRRDLQRAIQQLVLKMRAEGKSKQEIGVAKQELKAQAGQLLQPSTKKAKKAKEWKEWVQSDEAKKERKAKSEREHELVVIPVVWRGRHDQLEVLKAAEDVKACVAQQGVDVWLDSRRHYKPGQKFAHWEHRGVMLRVEVGPEDLQAGVCRVCRAKSPGDYQTVERKRVRLPPAGARALLLTLKDWGLSKIPIERRPGDCDSSDEGVAPRVLAKDSVGAKAQGPNTGADAATGADDVEGNWMPRVSAVETKRKEKKGKKRKVG